MKNINFEAPIPGMSLTKTPKNAPYERPPAINDPEEALLMHLSRLEDPEKLVDLMLMLEMGLDIKTVTEGMIRAAVSRGIYSLDVGLIIAPVIHEFIKTTADESGVVYDEGLVDKKAKERKKKAIESSLARKALKDRKPVDVSEEVEEAKEVMQEEQEVAPEAPSKGLMARR